ncbi:hypothetical protein COY90_02080 [Candidatus Roizmanbacteria bacterium CG_4_10_14_0_8_um_filter_39_9]|uniref:Glycosyl transferase family 1 domain-containing protein n=1 Tax=Candidatus Roizmanbacteria bacterium CG_4_10_14_0_8_um_filter_39_9 TaxID=1974829 RepID=A0A2M7QD79_9BACT|nr:MAG: hypothetical protein COY90_02080 [Candidatus Roizmanbacteria bacterium CG_4_10_14_0_8_um_filter_39_9]
MKIGIDISQIIYEGTGVARFVNGLTHNILSHDRSNQWTFFFSSLRQGVSPSLKKEIQVKDHRLVEIKLPPTALSFLWNRAHRLKVEKIIGPQDCFISSDWTEPPSLIPKITIIHDLAYLKYPKTVHPLIRQTQQNRMRWVMKESSLIFADSLSTKSDIEDLLKIDGHKIVANYPGVDIINPKQDTLQKVKAKYKLNKKFILSVGKIEPRKNIQGLITAYTNLKQDDVDLVVVGHQGWDEATALFKKRLNPHIHFLNYVSDLELPALYRACLFFIYPSFYEGFGFPVAEAMKLGVATATSSTSSLREIGENSCLLFDPHSINKIQEAMNSLIHNPILRNRLITSGLQKSKKFTWNNYYQIMTDSITNLIQ